MLRRGVFALSPFGHILTPPEPFRFQLSQSSPPEGFPNRSTWKLPDPHDAKSENLSPRKFMLRLLQLPCNDKIASK